MTDKELGIMIVEDDAIDVENIKRAFDKHKIQNETAYASNGFEALNLLRGDNGSAKLDPLPKIILLDLNMPKMNGIEFLQEIRKDPQLKHLTVFVFTTSNDDKDKVAAYDLNVAGYILKPMKFDAFAQAMSTLDLYWSLIELPQK